MSDLTPSALTIEYIGKAYTPYNEKFAIPRQPGIVTHAAGHIELFDQQQASQMLQGIEQYSHIWVIFGFHATAPHGWKAMVRPPRLGGNKKMGVLATRSTYRPNPIGMSVVKLDGISQRESKTLINISGMDLLNETPIIDIKPYVPYADALTNATSSFAQEADSTINVTFSSTALTAIEHFDAQHKNLKALITQVLAQDPRPAYKKDQDDKKRYGMNLYQLNITWHMINKTTAHVCNIEPVNNEN